MWLNWVIFSMILAPVSLNVFLLDTAKVTLHKNDPLFKNAHAAKISSGSDAEDYEFPQFCLQFQASATADISTLDKICDTTAMIWKGT